MTRIHGRGWVAATLAVCLGVLPSLVVAADNATVDATVTVAPIVIELALSATEAAVGQRVQARVTVANVGSSSVGPIDLTLRADNGGVRVQGDAVKTNGRLAAGKEWSVAWVVCGRQAGSFVLLVTAHLGQMSIDSDAHVLTIRPKPGSSC